MRTWRPLAVMAIVLVAVPRSASAQEAGRNPPYTLEDVVTLVQGGHAAARILARISDDCVSFRVADVEAQLRRAGADDALITGLKDVCVRSVQPEPRPTSQAATRRGYVHIVGDLPPGWTRKVNELPENTNRDIDMTPARRNFVTVAAPGWCPQTIEIAVEAGENRNWTPTLRPRPWIGECPETTGGPT